MYDKFIEDLTICYRVSYGLLAEGDMTDDCVLWCPLLYSFLQKIERIFFLRNFRNKDFVCEWGVQHKEEADQIAEMTSVVARDLEAYSKQTKERPFCTSDEMEKKLIVCNNLLDKMITDIKDGVKSDLRE